MEPFIGEIRSFGFAFAPMNYAFCSGQTTAISQNEALYSIIGTIYGGDGQTTFNLPNLQGQVPMGWGSGGPAGFNTDIGQVMGTSMVTLTSQQMPQHNHVVTAAQASDTSERSAGPTNSAYLGSASNHNLPWIAPATDFSASFASNTLSLSGNGISHDNMQPYLGLNFCIALYGIFPSRN